MKPLPNKTKIEVVNYPVCSTSAQSLGLMNNLMGGLSLILMVLWSQESLKDQFITIGGTLLKTEQAQGRSSQLYLSGY